MAKITPEEVLRLDVESIADIGRVVDISSLKLAALLSIPAIQRLVVTKCVEAASDPNRDVLFLRGTSDAYVVDADEIIDALCPPENPNA